MTTKSDYYQILGISKGASEEDIKGAYRKLAMKYHPDKNPGNKMAEDKFREATEAYEVLKDPKRRSEYDRYGHNAFQGRPDFHYNGFNTSDAFNAFMHDFGNFDDFFSDFFGRTHQKRKQQSIKGSDLRINLSLSMEESAKGVKKTIRIKRKARCAVCKGVGSPSPGSKTMCHVCGGSGRIGGGFFRLPCPDCGGSGLIFMNTCTSCHGSGLETTESTINVNIPAGVVDTNYVTLPGQGDAGPQNGPNGDLIITISLNQHPLFRREGRDLYYQVLLPFSKVTLGTSLEIPTFDGKVTLKIPAGTQTEKVFRIKNKGLPEVGGKNSGDLLVTVRVQIPEKTNSTIKKLLEQLSEEGL